MGAETQADMQADKQTDRGKVLRFHSHFKHSLFPRSLQEQLDNARENSIPGTPLDCVCVCVCVTLLRFTGNTIVTLAKNLSRS